MGGLAMETPLALRHASHVIRRPAPPMLKSPRVRNKACDASRSTDRPPRLTV